MTYRTKIIITGFLLSFISLLAYAALRIDFFEKQLAGNMKKKNGTIIRAYQKTFGEKEIKTLKNDDLSVFLNTLNRLVSDTAMLVIADTEKNIKISSKNDSLIRSSEIYDLIMLDYTGNKLTIKEPGGFIVRYYTSSKNENQKNLKYYIFNNNMGTGSILAVFPHKPDRVILTRAGLEIALILLIIFILCMMAFIIHSRQGSVVVVKDETPKTGHSTTTVNRTIDREERSVVRESISMVSEGLSAYVYDLFREISTALHPEELSLFVTGGRNTLIKLFEYRGNSFLKIDSPVFDAMDLDTDLGREMLSGTPIILLKGKKAVLPLIHEGSLLGTIHISAAGTLSGEEIDRVERMSRTVIKQLSEFMVLSNVMTDRASGMYSETYFKMKLNETERGMLKSKKHFSVILISIARNIRNLNEDEKNAVLKTIAPIVDDEIRENHMICRYGRFIAVLLPESGSIKTGKVARRIFRVLSELRVKMSDEEYLDITPFIGVASSDTAPEACNVLNVAQKNIDLALTREDGNIQDSRIKV